jgi:hypothetical protein
MSTRIFSPISDMALPDFKGNLYSLGPSHRQEGCGNIPIWPHPPAWHYLKDAVHALLRADAPDPCGSTCSRPTISFAE